MNCKMDQHLAAHSLPWHLDDMLPFLLGIPAWSAR